MGKEQTTDFQEVIKESINKFDELPRTPNKIKTATRTTFNLSKRTHEAMLLLCANYGMKQREFIDDVVVPISSSIVENPEWQNLLSELKDSNQSEDCERKTFVMSKASRKKLNESHKKTDNSIL
jgi:hypothetical protein